MPRPARWTHGMHKNAAEKGMAYGTEGPSRVTQGPAQTRWTSGILGTPCWSRRSRATSDSATAAPISAPPSARKSSGEQAPASGDTCLPPASRHPQPRALRPTGPPAASRPKAGVTESRSRTRPNRARGGPEARWER